MKRDWKPILAKLLFLLLIIFIWQSLIDKDSGAPQEMAGLATHLHYHEPANFVLVSFLQGGLFHELCEPERNGKGPINANLTNFEKCNIP